MADYGFFITKDHLENKSDRSAVGVCRVSPDASQKFQIMLVGKLADFRVSAKKPNGGHHFRLYDDDKILYFEGYTFWEDEEEGSEDSCFAPLEWGRRDAGCTEVRYTGHKEWDCG